FSLFHPTGAQRFHFFFVQQPVPPHWHALQRQRSHANSNQLLDRMLRAKQLIAQRVALCTAQRSLIPEIRGASRRSTPSALASCGVGLTHHTQPHARTFPQLRQFFQREPTFHFDVICLLELVPLLLHLGGKITVVRQKDQTCGRILQISNRIHPLLEPAQQIP